MRDCAYCIISAHAENSYLNGDGDKMKNGLVLVGRGGHDDSILVLLLNLLSSSYSSCCWYEYFSGDFCDG